MSILTFETKMAYLAAFIDAEGWVCCHLAPRSNKLRRQIGFTNTNKPLFDRVVSFAAEAGLQFTVGKPRPNNNRHAPRYNATLTGGRTAYERFNALVPIQHPEKRARLDMIIERYLTLDHAKLKRAQAWRESMSHERQVEIAAIARNARHGRCHGGHSRSIEQREDGF